MAVARTGDRLVRVEDPALLRGDSTFVANLDLEGAAVVHYVTSVVAHARIVGLDVTEAAQAPGVLLVATAAELAASGCMTTMPGHSADHPAETVRPVLADERVLYVGQPIVAIVAETEAQAADAAELVVVEYEPLDAVVDLATAHDAAPIHPVDSNVMAREALPDGARVATSAFEVVVEMTINNSRVAPVPIEGRVAASEWVDGRLLHHAACQGVHPQRAALAQFHGLEIDQVRVRTADVGGSFGAKARNYPEDLLLGWFARELDRPVRWTSPRSTDMVGLGHSRAQLQTITIAGDRSGRIRALQAHIRVDTGAYPVGGLALARNTGRMMPGPYDIEHVHWSLDAVCTNTTPIVAYRGAGRPESGAMVDRAVDRFAAEIGMDPIEVRRMNLLAADRLPWTNPTKVTYDTGNYAEAFEQLLDQVDADGLRSEQQRRRAAGDERLLGLGFSVFVDRTAGYPGSEYGSVQLRGDGTVRVLTGSSPYGQGHYTTWKQLVSERTGLPVEAIEIFHGDTDVVPRGGITGGSKAAQRAGSAVAVATDELVEIARAHAADILEAAVDDVVLDISSGHFHVSGAPGASTVAWIEVANGISGGQSDPHEIVYACETDYEGQHTVPYGAYAAVVEVDERTGKVDLLRIVTIDDAGTVINPMIALGQVHGGVGQGIGQVLYEDFVYDADGNPLSANLLDYAVPSAAELPSIEATLTEHPTPNNVLGAKGIGESGTIGAVPAVQNAVVDAVSHLGVRHIDMPLTPQRVWRAISASRSD